MKPADRLDTKARTANASTASRGSVSELARRCSLPIIDAMGVAAPSHTHTALLKLSPAFYAALKQVGPRKQRARIRYVLGLTLFAMLAVLAADVSTREFARAHGHATMARWRSHAPAAVVSGLTSVTASLTHRRSMSSPTTAPALVSTPALRVPLRTRSPRAWPPRRPKPARRPRRAPRTQRVNAPPSSPRRRRHGARRKKSAGTPFQRALPTPHRPERVPSNWRRHPITAEA